MKNLIVGVVATVVIVAIGLGTTAAIGTLINAILPFENIWMAAVTGITGLFAILIVGAICYSIGESIVEAWGDKR